MRNTFMALAFGIWTIGCGGTGAPVQNGGGVDMAQAAVGGNGGQGGGGGGGSAGGGGGGGGGVAVDMAGHHGDMGSHNGGGDMASTSTDMAGKAPFGAPCTANADCSTNVCFMGGMGSFCSMLCQTNADCPVPPTSGVCNTRGYCK